MSKQAAIKRVTQQCIWEGCDKKQADPFEYCLDHFADATAGYYITAMRMGVKLPAWSNDSTGFGGWQPMKPGKKGRSGNAI